MVLHNLSLIESGTRTGCILKENFALKPFTSRMVKQLTKGHRDHSSQLLLDTSKRYPN